jgi:hypothetical protein
MLQDHWIKHLAADQTTPGDESALTGLVMDIEEIVLHHVSVAARTVHRVPSMRHDHA